MTNRIVQILSLAGLVAAGNQAEAAPDSAKIYEAVRAGSPAALRKLLEEGISVNHKDEGGNSLLLQTAMYGSVDAMRFLIERGGGMINVVR